jgi:hypothetical protein
MLLGHPKEFYAGPSLLNPPHFPQIDLNGRPIIQVHFERDVLVAREEF